MAPATEDEDDAGDCPMGTCDGSGWYWDESDPVNDGPDGVLRPCPWCGSREGEPDGDSGD